MGKLPAANGARKNKSNKVQKRSAKPGNHVPWSKSQVVSEIRAQHRRGNDLSFTGQRGSALWGAAFRYFGSYRSAIEAAGVDYNLIWRRRFTKWDPKKIQQELKRLYRADEDLSSRVLRQTHSKLFSAAVHWFGSYRAAIESAKLDYVRIRRQDPERWSRENILRDIKKMHRGHEPLYHNAMSRTAPELVTAAYRYFGTYEKAVRSAGINYETVRVRPQRTWTERRVIGELKKLRDEGHGLWPRSVRQVQPYLTRAAKDLFGSYRAAAKAAGIDSASIKAPEYRIWSPEHIIEELHRVSKNGKRIQLLSPTRMRESHPNLVRACERRFGTYRKGIEAAGVDYSLIARLMPKAMPASEVIARLRSMQEAGKDLRYSVMNRTHPRLLNASRRRFGSYEGAFKAAGIAYPPLAPLRHWTEAMVIRTLHDLHKKREDLRFRAVKKQRLPLFEAARYYFGSYPNAVRVANLDYDDVVRKQRTMDRKRAQSKNAAGRK